MLLLVLRHFLDLTKLLSYLLTKLSSTIRDRLERYCNSNNSCNGVNNMWITDVSCHHLTNVTCVQLQQSRHLIFQRFTFQSQYVLFNSNDLFLITLVTIKRMPNTFHSTERINLSEYFHVFQIN